MSQDKKPSEKALQIAVQCWCDKETSHRVMDVDLAVAFAKRLDNNYNAIAELTERNIAYKAKLAACEAKRKEAVKRYHKYREERDQAIADAKAMAEALSLIAPKHVDPEVLDLWASVDFSIADKALTPERRERYLK